MKIKNKAQQEIVGFVLIVVLVVIGLMIYLTISVRTSPESDNSLEVANALDAMMKQTTECAVVYVPNYDDVEDLFKSAAQGDRCSNLGITAFDYLNKTLLPEVLSDMMASESSITGYEFQFYERESSQGLIRIIEGNCSVGQIKSAKRTLASGSNRLDIVLKACFI